MRNDAAYIDKKNNIEEFFLNNRVVIKEENKDENKHNRNKSINSDKTLMTNSDSPNQNDIKYRIKVKTINDPIEAIPEENKYLDGNIESIFIMKY